MNKIRKLESQVKDKQGMAKVAQAYLAEKTKSHQLENLAINLKGHSTTQLLNHGEVKGKLPKAHDDQIEELNRAMAFVNNTSRQA